ncbi:hypothetical protein HBA55_17590 [Pseudomaricurvus alkylphenolicus]|uniref:hypothetical protein n=1 Tax=Pseudomaricurvus alkylphenolicus TaxID=1306991 RepID=UPI0014215367|nr:hypothetical protein [Pseudomaricurvus alkylphenolicus]NIB41421.1 hypothetical protein [Pseudomaricurvus alkylphenolicus]
MKPLHWTLYSAAALTAILVALLNLPLNRILASSQAPVTIVDTVTLASGTVYVKPSQAPVWRIRYRWCPGQGLTSWCIDGRSGESFLQGIAHWQGGTALALANIEVSAHSDQLPGIAAPASFTLTARASHVAVASLACGQQQIAVGDALVTLSNLKVLGNSLMDSQVSLHGSQPVRLSLTGSFSGSGQIANGKLSLQAQPSANLDTPHTHSGWSFRAKLPCLA